VRACLTERALVRVLADLGTVAERAHLATCPACAARCRRMTDELDTIRQVLAARAEPVAASAAPGRRSRWLPAAAMVTALLAGGLVWMEVALWKGVLPPKAPSVTEEAESEQVTQALASLSAALFSVSGEPTEARADAVALSLQPDDERDPACDGPDELTALECADPPSAADSQTWALDNEFLETDDPDPGSP
jgi:anti-sigma factor RsiW